MSQTNASKRFFGHPRQLSTLFHIELWERFSFYGMQDILLIYLYYQTTQGGLGLDNWRTSTSSNTARPAG